MFTLPLLLSRCVSTLTPRIVTLLTVVLLAGCSYLERRYGEECKTRAWVQVPLAAHLTTRFGSEAPVRLAVIPFSVPANVASMDTNRPGLDNQIAWAVQRVLLGTEVIPIVEVLNRQDWPGKKDEFFTGNFGALQFARDAGYDLVLVGYLEPFTRSDAISAFAKVIEVDSGITLWYGQTSVQTNRDNFNAFIQGMGVSDRDPSRNYLPELIERLASCLSKSIVAE
jgi:hypothetical protein